MQSKLWCCLALLVAVGTTQSRATAQPTLAQASETQAQAARDAFQAGKDAFGQEQYEIALERFAAADDAVASPNTKLMIARCFARLNRLAEAYTSFSELIREAETWGDGRYEQAARAAADERLALKPRIAMLTVDVRDPSGQASLTVAGRVVPRFGWIEPIAIDPGTFEVVLEGGSGERDSHQMTLEPGVAATLELAIEAVPAANLLPAPKPDAVAPAPSAAATSTASGPGLRTFGYVAGAAGVAGMAAFAVFGALSTASFAQLEDACPERMGCPSSLSDKAERGRTYQTIANVSLGVGAAALGAGVVLWLLGGQDEQVEVAITPTGLRVGGAL